MPLTPALWRQLLCSQKPQETVIAQVGELLSYAPLPMFVKVPLDDYVLAVTGSEQTVTQQNSVLGGDMDSCTAISSQRTRQDQNLCVETGNLHVPFEVPISTTTVLSSYVDIMVEFQNNLTILQLHHC